MQSFLGLEPLKGSGSLILTLLGRLDLTRSLIALAIVVALMGWVFLVGGTALGVVLGPAEGLAESCGRLAEGSGVG